MEIFAYLPGRDGTLGVAMDEQRYCTSRGFVVDKSWWLPTEPYDYDWPGGPCVGCNHLRCSRCGEPVTATLRSGSSVRHYECRCLSHDEGDRQLLDPTYTGYPGLSALHDPAPAGWWGCAGHPPLPVPSVVDGVPIVPDQFREIARTGFASPPFIPPGSSGRAIWVSRLYWILPEALRPELSMAVSELWLDDDPWVIRGALDFHSAQPSAAGQERLTAFAREHRARLARIVDPFNPNLTLEDVLLFTLASRAFRRDDAGQLVDPEANAMLRETLLSGTNLEVADDVIYTFARLEPDWFAANAAAIAKHAPSLVATIVFLFSKQPPDARRITAIRAIAELGPAIRADLLEAIEERFEGDERARVLAALSSR